MPETVHDLIRSVARELLVEHGVIDDQSDDDQSDQTDIDGLALDHAALRHIVATRFPDLDLDAEIALVSGLELSDDGEVTGEASYEPSTSMRSTVGGRRRRQPNPTSQPRRELNHQTIAAMSPEEYEQNRDQIFAELAR